jgi:hypothetical protein
MTMPRHFGPQNMRGKAVWGWWAAPLLTTTFFLPPTIADGATGSHAVIEPRAEPVEVHAQRNRNAVEVRISTVIAAPLEVIWRVLTDYGRFPEFVPDFISSQVIGRAGKRSVVKQRGTARFLWLSFPIDIIVEAIEDYPNQVRVEKISGNLVQLSGRYDLNPVSNASELGGAARQAYLLRWTGIIEPDMELPPLVGRVALSHNLEQQFRALVAEIERRKRGGQ